MMKLIRTSVFLFILLASVLSCKQELVNSSEYSIDKEWIYTKGYDRIGEPVGLAVNTKNELIVLHRANRPMTDEFPFANIEENTIMHLNLNDGKANLHWGADLFIMPHGLFVDHQNNIWIADIGRHQVLGFTSKGLLRVTLGTRRKAGKDETHFDQPTDVVVSPVDGSIYVSDGYGNNRVVKFDKDGQYVKAWGTDGSDDGSFQTPHSIALTNNEEILVSDRENKRIQMFDTDGNFIKKWDNDMDKVFSSAFDKSTEDLIYVDFSSPLVGDKSSSVNMLRKNGDKEKIVIPGAQYHDVTIDQNGRIFAADLLTKNVHVFSPPSK